MDANVTPFRNARAADVRSMHSNHVSGIKEVA
jgi:hypothetical protein